MRADLIFSISFLHWLVVERSLKQLRFKPCSAVRRGWLFLPLPGLMVLIFSQVF